MNVRILVTGSNGFLARHLIPELRRRYSCAIVGLGRASVCKAPVDDYIHANLTDYLTLRAAVRKLMPTAIFHLAGSYRKTIHELHRDNIVATDVLLRVVQEVVPEARILAIGSAAEYGNGTPPITEEATCQPIEPYGTSKLAATKLLVAAHKTWGARVAIARLFNVVGPGIPDHLLIGAVITRIIHALDTATDHICVGNIKAMRDFIAATDVVDGLVRLYEADRWGSIFNLCSGIPTPVADVVQTLLSLAPRPLHTIFDPALVRPQEIPVSYGSPAKAHGAVGFRARTPLVDVLRETWFARKSNA